MTPELDQQQSCFNGTMNPTRAVPRKQNMTHLPMIDARGGSQNVAFKRHFSIMFDLI